LGDATVETIWPDADLRRTYWEDFVSDDFEFLKSSSAFFMQSRWAWLPDRFLQACFASSIEAGFLRCCDVDVDESGDVVGFSRMVGWVGGVAGDAAGGVVACPIAGVNVAPSRTAATVQAI
jgi:hypothetical protein